MCDKCKDLERRIKILEMELKNADDRWLSLHKKIDAAIEIIEGKK